jgi:hypothetical protein
MTPLLYAMLNSREEAVTALFKAGADDSIIDVRYLYLGMCGKW